MPADPTANLGPSRLETLPDYIGHIAPSFKSPKQFNALAIRPKYRISLKLGEIEHLFVAAPDTPLGRMERLQVLGLFYWPLNHRLAAGKRSEPIAKAKRNDIKAKAAALVTAATDCRAPIQTLLNRCNATQTTVQNFDAAPDPSPARNAAVTQLGTDLTNAQGARSAAGTELVQLQTAIDEFHTECSGTGMASWGDHIRDAIRTMTAGIWLECRDKINDAKTQYDAGTLDRGSIANAKALADAMLRSINDTIAECQAAKTAADGYGAAGFNPGPRQNPNGEAFRVAWQYFKDTFCGGGSDAAADQEIQKRLKEWVVQKHKDPVANCAYNTAGETPGGGKLPLPIKGEAKPSEAAGNFAKIRLPGGYPLLSPFDGSWYANRDTAAGVPAMGLTDNPYVTEDTVYQHNVVLGKIPLVAVVEKWSPKEGKWKKAPKNVEVRFKLVKPYDLPDFDPARDLNKQLNRAPLRDSAWSVTDPTPRSVASGTGPKHFTKVLEEHGWNDGNKDDPMRQNAMNSFGGKRAGGIADVIFKTGRVNGFTHHHQPPPAEIGGGSARPKRPNAVYFRECESAGADAVKCNTNDEGEAGVIFMPSRCAGDRYRVKAWIVDPEDPQPAQDGEGAQATLVETGTFITWRNIRFSRLARFNLPAPTALNAHMLEHASVNGQNKYKKIPVGARWMWDFIAVKYGESAGMGLHNIRVEGTLSDGKVGSPWDPIHAHFARAFCELDCDPNFNRPVTQQEWTDGVDMGLKDGKLLGIGRFNLALDIDKLFYKDATAAGWGIDHTTGFLFPAMTPLEYDNAMGGVAYLTGAGNQANRRNLGSWISDWLYYGFIRSIAKQGYLPGFTIVHTVHVTNIGNESGDFNLNFSGLATHYNAAYNIFGGDNYKYPGGSWAGWPEKIGAKSWFGYGYDSNVLHEIGHVLYKEHDAGLHGGSPAGGPQPNYHDNAGYIPDVNVDEPPHGTCVMSYRNCEGQFCAKCNMGLRGWNVKGAGALHAQMAAPVPPAAPAPSGPGAAIKGFFGKLFG